MEQSPPLEANLFSTSQEISHIFWMFLKEKPWWSFLLQTTPLATHLLKTPSEVDCKFLSGKKKEIFETRRFTTAFTVARYLSLYWARSIQSMPPQPTSWISILTSYYLCLDLPSGLFLSGFPTKNLCVPFLHPYVLHVPSISFFSILSSE